jgi:hypothetical protein
MIGRNPSMSLDGTLISQNDLNRMAEEERLFAARQRRVVRVIASVAIDADDCRMLLAMLGLDDEVVSAARGEHDAAGENARTTAAA